VADAQGNQETVWGNGDKRGAWRVGLPGTFVIPAKAGIHLDLASKSAMDPGYRFAIPG
jgi:hypothetical protein